MKDSGRKSAKRLKRRCARRAAASPARTARRGAWGSRLRHSTSASRDLALTSFSTAERNDDVEVEQRLIPNSQHWRIQVTYKHRRQAFRVPTSVGRAWRAATLPTEVGTLNACLRCL